MRSFLKLTMTAAAIALVASCVAPHPPEPIRPTETQPQVTVTQAPQSGDIILDGAQSYTVVQGDALSTISKRFYGEENYFPLIMLASSGIQDPDVLEKDTRLTIPNLRRNLDDPGARARIKRYIGEIATIYSNRDRPYYATGLRNLANSL